jgi:hypothetical protein
MKKAEKRSVWSKPAKYWRASGGGWLPRLVYTIPPPKVPPFAV